MGTSPSREIRPIIPFCSFVKGLLILKEVHQQTSAYTLPPLATPSPAGNFPAGNFLAGCTGGTEITHPKLTLFVYTRYVCVSPDDDDDDDDVTTGAEVWKPAFAATDRTRTADSGVESEAIGVAALTPSVTAKLAKLDGAARVSNGKAPAKKSTLDIPRPSTGAPKSSPVVAQSGAVGDVISSAAAPTRSDGAHQKVDPNVVSGGPDLEMEKAQDTGDAMVITPYTSRMEDELTLVPGQFIRVLDVADDGWVLGRNVTSGEKGWFHGSYIQSNSDAVFCHATREFRPEGAPTALPLTQGERLRVRRPFLHWHNLNTLL